MANPAIQSLLQKEVTRKEFLGLLVLGVASIAGFGQIIKMLTGKSLATHKAFDGYSSNLYGK